MSRTNHVKKPMQVILPRKLPHWHNNYYLNQQHSSLFDIGDIKDTQLETRGWKESKGNFTKKTLPLIIFFIIIYLPLL